MYNMVCMYNNMYNIFLKNFLCPNRGPGGQRGGPSLQQHTPGIRHAAAYHTAGTAAVRVFVQHRAGAQQQPSWR